MIGVVHILSRSGRPSSRRRRAGLVLLLCMIGMIAWAALASLAVDYGHVALVRTQLQFAADAAARAATLSLASSTVGNQYAPALSAAVAVASKNSADGMPVAVASADVILGNWDASQSPNFSAARTPYNAVQVTTHRDSTHGNSVSLIWGSVIGFNTFNLTRDATAKITMPMSDYGIVGINSVTFSSLGVLAGINGDVVSNGDIKIGTPLGLLVSVTGSARSYSGHVTHGALASIQGSTTALSDQLNYPHVTLPVSNDNAKIASYLDWSNNFSAAVYAEIPTGTYVVHDLNFLAGVIINLEGPVTFYVTGSFNDAASINLLGANNASPSNFNVNVLAGGSVNFLAPLLVPMYMNVYAPQSPISIAVPVANYTGMLIGSTLSIQLPVLGSFTEVKPSQTSPVISMVE